MVGSGRGLIFQVLYRRLSAGIQKYHENLSEDSLSPGRYLNLKPLRYEPGALATRPRPSVKLYKDSI